MTASNTSVHESWPALNIQLESIDSLIPYIRNPRLHSQEQIAQLAASMREFGWVNPVLRDEDGTILAGHGRILAARLNHWEQAPVMIARDWPDAKKRAFIIADNKLALNATWDIQLLSSEIEFLADQNFDLDVLGFSEEDMNRMADDLMSDRFGDAEQPPAEQPQPETQRSTSNPETVQLTLPMTVDQRATCFEAIQKAKRDEQLDHSGEALWQICKRYLERE